MSLRNYVLKEKSGVILGIDGHWAVSGDLIVDGASTLTGAVGITGDLIVDGASTLTGAVGITGALTYDTGLACTPAAIAADGTLAGEGMSVYDAASGAIHLPLVADFDGYTIKVANIHATGTATLTADATDSAAIKVSGATGATFALTPNVVVSLTAYAAGTCWIGVS